jgi:hypothetical protein
VPSLVVFTHTAVLALGAVWDYSEVVRSGGTMHEFAGGTPVFVDRRGRRRRWMTYWGLLVACLGVLYVALLTASLAADPVRPDGGAPADAPPAQPASPPAEADVPE